MGAIPALSNQAYDYVAGLLTGWRNLLKRRGWYERTIQHVGDEPNTRVADEYRVLSGIVRKFMPGIRLIDAVEMYELRGDLDMVHNIYYAENSICAVWATNCGSIPAVSRAATIATVSLICHFCARVCCSGATTSTTSRAICTGDLITGLRALTRMRILVLRAARIHTGLRAIRTSYTRWAAM